MYDLLLFAHSWLRWIVLLAGLAALVRAMTGVSTRRPWGPLDDRGGMWFTAALDLQMLLGLVLYAFLSPVTQSAFVDMAAAMRAAPIRFFAVEHPVGMIVAIALAHVGRVRVRKAADSESRHKLTIVFFGLALVVLLLSMPWPIGPGARSLFRGL
jgi:uncharacterized membrane protein